MLGLKSAWAEMRLYTTDTHPDAFWVTYQLTLPGERHAQEGSIRILPFPARPSLCKCKYVAVLLPSSPSLMPWLSASTRTLFCTQTICSRNINSLHAERPGRSKPLDVAGSQWKAYCACGICVCTLTCPVLGLLVCSHASSDNKIPARQT